MDGIKINGITLFLGKLPGRKSLCFYFEDEKEIVPVAYVKSGREEIASIKWNIMLGDFIDYDSNKVV